MVSALLTLWSGAPRAPSRGPVVAPFNLSEWTLQAWTETGLVTVIEDADGRPTVVRFHLEPPGG
jgi:hypothetical protein